MRQRFVMIENYRLKASFVAMLFTAVAGLALPAAASIRLPTIVTTEKLKSHAACAARLEAEYAIDQMQVRPKSKAADGSTSEVTLHSETSGVQRESRKVAHYTGRLWFVFSFVRSDINRRETRASWSEKRLTCAGRMLTTAQSGGATMNSFWPLDKPEEGPDVEPPLEE